nr:immunoglobulin light chain junction region [Macaca mulatta]MOX77820.1 immunoglobulin light chain junction region [Macaca mulatta]MOX77873.1 immunoglobulin light chain junction region [Macaca mulatta]MOX78283.1 immunoglobulin light chain junction region [Macaca mulatta]MOX78644.1 immunoglobulin light chain junction region [Macaca mulatta]
DYYCAIWHRTAYIF